VIPAGFINTFISLLTRNVFHIKLVSLETELFPDILRAPSLNIPGFNQNT
jgi:hypothetical protein